MQRTNKDMVQHLYSMVHMHGLVSFIMLYHNFQTLQRSGYVCSVLLQCALMPIARRSACHTQIDNTRVQ
jgi:hypothetical protein